MAIKFKTTAKAIKQGGGRILSVSYCGMQELLSYHSPIAYAAGVYGWNFDVYAVNGVTICTGYRGMPGKSVNYELLREYETKAEKIHYNRDIPYEAKPELIDELLREFLSRVA